MSESLVALYGSLGIVIDQSSWTKAQRHYHKFHTDMQRRLDNLSPPTMRIQKFGDAVRRAGAPLAAIASRFARLGSTLAIGGALGGGGMAVKNALSFSKILTDISVSSGGAVGNLDELRKKFIATSTATAVAKEDVAAVVKGYITLTGDAKTATAAAETFSRVMYGQAASAEDVAGSAAAMAQQFGITAQEMEQAFSILSAGGKAGKIELRDMAAFTAELGAGFKKFGDSGGLDGVTKLSAIFQVAARNFGNDAGQAATGVEALMGGIQQINKSKIKGAGIKGFSAYEKDGKTLKPLLEIVDEISKKNLNGTQLFTLLGRKEAVNTFEALRDNRDVIDEIATKTRRARDVQNDFAARSASGAARAEKAWNKFKNQIASLFTEDVIEKIGFAVEALLESFVEFGKGFKYWVIDPLVAGIKALIDFGKVAADTAKKFSFNLIGGSVGGGIANTVGDIGESEFEAMKLREGGVSAAEIPALIKTGYGGKMLKSAAKAAAAVNVTSAVTVNVPPGADASGVAKVVERTMNLFWDAKVRELATGGGT